MTLQNLDTAILMQDASDQSVEITERAEPLPQVVDDVGKIGPGDKVIMIVDNDLAFARYLLDTAHEKGFKGLIASRGAEALAIAREHKPDAITLDINRHDIDGWRVLYHLKDDFS